MNNFALSAIIIIILLLPGAVAIRAYYSSLKEKESSIYVSFNELLLNGLILTFLIHSMAICIIRFFGFYIKFNFLYSLLLGKDEKAFVFTDKELTTNFLQFCLYNICLIGVLAFASKVFKWYVRSRNLDLKYYTLKNTNYWFHIFHARYLEEKGIQGKQVNTDLIWVDVLFDNDVIYSGFLIDFNYSSQKDELENIVLRDTVKIICNHTIEGADDDNITSEPQRIPGDIFVLPMKKMVNINVYYINYVTAEEDVTPTLDNDSP